MADYSIPQIKAPEVQSPLETLQRVMTLKALGTQAQERQVELQQKQVQLAGAQRDFNDQTLMRAAAQKNMIQDDVTGVPTLHMPGYLADISKGVGDTPGNSLLAQSEGLRLQKMAMEKQHAQHEAGGELLFSPIKSQEDLDNVYKKGAELGLSVPQLQRQLGTNFNDPNFDQNLKDTQMRYLSGDKQIQQQNTQIQQKMKQAEFDLAQSKQEEQKRQFGITSEQREKSLALQTKTKELELQKYGFEQTKFHAGQVEKTLGQLQSARGNPMVSKAENDLYAAKKIDAFEKAYPDPNKMPKQIADLYISEIAKVAQGGVPTQGELKGLSQETLKSQLAGAWQKLSGDPTPAGLGAFMKEYSKYAHLISKDAKNVMEENYGRVIESQKPYLLGSDYENLNKQYLRKLQGEDVPGPWAQAEAKKEQKGKSEAGGETAIAGGKHPQDDVALKWAQDPKSAGWTKEKADRILKANGKK